MAKKIILNAGCGRTSEKDKQAGKDESADAKTVYIDIRDNIGADVVHDLNKTPLPFRDNHFDEIILSHIIEHLHDVYGFLEEIHRILKPGGIARIIVPHYTDWTYWTDPSHIRHFNSYSFDRFQETEAHHFDTKYPFKVVELSVDLQKIWRYLGVQFLVNFSIRHRSFRLFRKMWESYWCFLIRGITVKATLRAEKKHEGGGDPN